MHEQTGERSGGCKLAGSCFRLCPAAELNAWAVTQDVLAPSAPDMGQGLSNEPNGSRSMDHEREGVPVLCL